MKEHFWPNEYVKTMNEDYEERKSNLFRRSKSSIDVFEKATVLKKSKINNDSPSKFNI